MFDYTLNENGRFRDYGSAPRDYRTDVEGRKAAGFIRGGSKPFFLTVATLAPHGETRLFGEPRNPRPAPRHAQRFEDEPLPRPPSFNERNVADKPSFVRDLPRVDAETGSKWKEHHQDRLATLLAVDDAIRRIIAALRETGQLRNTLVILTSDNGFLLGEHRLKNKRELYEESARVPLVLRGPGVPEGAVREQVTGNIDLAPTILEAANAEAGSVMDGQSLLPFAEDPAHRRNRSILLENVIGKKWPYKSQAVRAPGAVYAEHSTGEEELYDLDADPFQLQSLHDAPAYAATEDTLDRRLEALRDCAGAGCR